MSVHKVVVRKAQATLAALALAISAAAGIAISSSSASTTGAQPKPVECGAFGWDLTGSSACK